MVRGPVGTPVRLRVQPVTGGDPIEYVINRKSPATAQPAAGPATRQEFQIAGYHPGLLSGLVLAGANLPPEPDQDNGILTALEVSSLDLSHVELVTLSACETGLGQTAGGEGLLGMQRAFQVAGAQSTVATLWKVSDDASRSLMIDFYENLWEKKMSRVEALRQAQIKMLREGVHRGVAIDDEPVDAQKHLPPFYWAAFELSGDWR
jgi:CHAT domain-containing protein